MKLLQVALAGFLGIAGLTAGASNGNPHVAHLNDDKYTWVVFFLTLACAFADFLLSYHCEELDITQCSILGSCSLYENCPHWCVDLTAPGGAVCADTPPKDIKSRGAAYDNDASAKYM
jgi:hypothetical protein